MSRLNIFLCETIILANKSKSLTSDEVKTIFILVFNWPCTKQAVDEIIG